MKKSKYFLLSISLLSFLFFSCKEQSSTLSTDLESQSSNLAASNSDNMVKLITRVGDGPLVERYVTPEIWDGKSEMKYGVVYQWNSWEEMLDAYKERRPESYAALKEMFEYKESQLSEGKKKAEVSPDLA